MANGPWKVEDVAAAMKTNPEQPLKGSVSIDEGIGNQVKALFPEPDDSALMTGVKAGAFVPQHAALGVMDLLENIGNLGLGVVESPLPQQQRKSVGDLMRMIPGMQGVPTAGEVLASPQYQQAAQENPFLGGYGAGSAMAGQFALPMGGVGAAAERFIPQAVKMAAGRIPFMGAAATGAGWGLGMGAGGQFGRERSLPGPMEAAGMAGGGAALGAGLGAAGRYLQGLLKNIQAKPAATPGMVPQIPQSQVSTVVPSGSKSPETMYQLTKAAALKLQGSGRPDTGKRQQDLFASIEKFGKDQGDPEYATKIAKLRAEIETLNLKGQTKASDRAYAEQQAANKQTAARQDTQQKQQFQLDKQQKGLEGRAQIQQERQRFSSEQMQKKVEQRTAETQQKQQFSAGEKEKSRGHAERMLEQRSQQRQNEAAQRLNQRRQLAEEAQGRRQQNEQAKIDRSTGHTTESGGAYRTLYGEIESADLQQLREIELDIMDSGPGPGGKPLLESWQRRNLMSQLHRRRRELNPEPGENNGGGGSSPSSPGGAPEQPAPQAPEAPQLPSAPPPQPTDDAAKFLAGTFRKDLPKEYRDVTKRYKLAVSVDTLADVGGLNQSERTALSKAISALSEAAVEKKIKEQELARLVEWFMTNEEKLLAKEGDIDRIFNDKGNIVLRHYGELKQLEFRVKSERVLEEGAKKQIELKRAELQLEGQKRGDLTEHDYRPDPNPSMETVINGRVEDWLAKQNGTLSVEGMQKLEPPSTFTEPVSLKEVWERATRLKKWIQHFREEMADIRAAEGEHDYLGDGTKPIDVMGKAFQNRRDIWEQGSDASKVPTAHVWHVDENGYVATTVFKQPRRALNWNDATRDLEERFNSFREQVVEEHEKLGDNIYDAVWLKEKLPRMMNGFTGLEVIPILSMFAAKVLHKAAKAATRDLNMQALTVGTVDNIIKSKVEFGGEKISQSMHNMIGRILEAFGRDEAGLLTKLQGAEDMTDLLNQFKGVKPNLRDYEREALLQLQRKGLLGDKNEVLKARMNARTAIMIRRAYKDLAENIQEGIPGEFIGLKELEARKTDLQTHGGRPPQERSKAYTQDQYLGDRLRGSVYDPHYHEALKNLHDSLLLRGEFKDGWSQFIGRMMSRKNASLFGNNFRTGFSNFFDAGIPTAIHFHRHFAKAVVDIVRDKRLANAIGRLPILPQADMEYIQLQEELARRPPPETLLQRARHAYEDVNAFLSTKADPIFHGKERVVSLADRLYSRAGALASIYKQASRLGMDGRALAEEVFFGGNLSAEQRQGVLTEVSKDLSQLYNSVAPHLNRDLLATSTIGKVLANYSAPKRRNFRLYWDWARGDVKDKSKFAIAMAMNLALGGRAVLPSSVRAGLVFAGAVGGANALVEQGLQNLDEANVMRKATGVDLSERIDFDMINLAGVQMDALLEWQGKAQKLAEKEKGGRLALDEAGLALQTTLSLFPRIGSFGADVWESARKDAMHVLENKKTYYVPLDGRVVPIELPGYTIADWARERVFAGKPPRAFEIAQDIKMNAAKKKDLKRQSAQGNIFPERESKSSVEIPGITSQGI